MTDVVDRARQAVVGVRDLIDRAPGLDPALLAYTFALVDVATATADLVELRRNHLAGLDQAVTGTRDAVAAASRAVTGTSWRTPTVAAALEWQPQNRPGR